MPAHSVRTDAHAPACRCFSSSVLLHTSTEVSVVMCMKRRAAVASLAVCAKRSWYQYGQ